MRPGAVRVRRHHRAPPERLNRAGSGACSPREGDGQGARDPGIRTFAREIGAPRRRVEDRRLLTGEGRFTDDAAPAGAARAFVVRSPHGHARIRRIDTARAAAHPGVLAVLTGADAAADGMRPIPHDPEWTGPPDVELRLPDGFEVAVTPNLPLPLDTVRYCGEAVALVVAETAAVAADAGELVEVDYEPLPAVTDARAAMAEDAPRLWPDCANNLALTCEVGDRAAADTAFARAAHVVSLQTRVHRVTGAPLEPRAVVGEYDPAARRHTLRTGSGRGAVQTRARLAATLGVPVERCRAVFGDMGGNFGTRNAFSPEYALIPWAARRTGRPVKWTADRRECFLSDHHGRDLVSEAALALDAEGNFLALRGVNTLNLGAYAVYFWPLRKGLSMMQGVYRIPAVHFRGHAVLTNTAPTAVYRSAGRPEAIYVIERLIDLAAEEHGFDRVALRRRNLIAPGAMPCTNAVGVTYDSGDYPAAMDAALAAADWPGFEARRARIGTQRASPRDRGRQLHRGDERHPPRAGGAAGARGRHRRARGRDHEQRPGPRDELSAARCRLARHSVRAGAPRRERHGPRVGGGRLALGPLHAPREHRHRPRPSPALIERGRAVAAFALQAAGPRGHRLARGRVPRRARGRERGRRHRPRRRGGWRRRRDQGREQGRIHRRRQHHARRCGGPRRLGREPARASPRPPRRGRRHHQPGRRLSLRLPRLRGGGRSRDRRGAHRGVDRDSTTSAARSIR